MPSASAKVPTDWVQVEEGVWREGHIFDIPSLPDDVPYRVIEVFFESDLSSSAVILAEDHQVRSGHAKACFSYNSAAQFSEQPASLRAAKFSKPKTWQWLEEKFNAVDDTRRAKQAELEADDFGGEEESQEQQQYQQ